MVKEAEKTQKSAGKPAEKKAAIPFLDKIPFLKKVNKKTLEIGIAVALIVIVLLIYFSTLGGGKSNNGSDSSGQTVTAAEYCEKVQKELEEFLSQIKGAGKVTALVNFKSSPELVIAYITNENKQKNASDGGNYTENTQTSSSPVILNQNGSQTALILKQIYPEATGAIIGAEGADDVKVKLALIDAVRTFLTLDAACVQVYALKKS